MDASVDIEVLYPRAGAAVVVLRGEHDVATKDEIGELLASLTAEHELLVVDVTHATFVDSSFLHNLVKAHRAAQKRGGRLRVQMGAEPIVRRAFEVSGLLERLECAATREEALGETPTGANDGGLRVSQ